jgi:5-formyltetrahydrofolate cyclo-ligase
MDSSRAQLSFHVSRLIDHAIDLDMERGEKIFSYTPLINFSNKLYTLLSMLRYYDSFIERSTEARRLKGLEAPVTIAIALTEQVLENGVIPLGEFDRKVDFVVTPAGTYHA